MLGNDNFLASPPPRKEGPKLQVATKRTVLQDLSNASASVASWWHGAGKKDAKKATQTQNDAPKPAGAKDLYVNLGDDGVVSPTRNALWNDDNAC